MRTFDLRSIDDIHTFAQAVSYLNGFYSVTYKALQLAILIDGHVYGLRSIGDSWWGYKKPHEGGSLMGDWDGILEYGFHCDNIGEAVAAFLYYIYAEGDRDEFEQIMKEVSYVKPQT